MNFILEIYDIILRGMKKISNKSSNKPILNAMKAKLGCDLRYSHFMIFLDFKRDDYWIYQIELFHKISPF